MAYLNLKHIYKKGDEGFTLSDIHLEMEQFQRVAIAGETGSGKTTLMKIIAGLIQPDDGLATFEGSRILGPADQLIPGHKGIAFLSQHFDLPQNLRVEQVLEYANELSDEEAAKIIEICDIQHLFKRKTHQLSGGEKQRTAIARLLISKPRLFLLDEPFSNLDLIHKYQLKNLFDRIEQELGISFMMVSHDAQDTLSWADYLYVLKEGKIIQSGKPSAVYFEPVNEYVAAILGRYNKVRQQLVKYDQQELFGEQYRYIRPQQIVITPLRQSNWRGKIASIQFFGTHYEVKIDTANGPIWLYTTWLKQKEGDEVGLMMRGSS